MTRTSAILVGKGHLNERAATIGEEHGASLVNHTEPWCEHARRCKPGTCPKARRHWFTIENLGHPFEASKARELKAALEAAGCATPDPEDPDGD